MQTLFELDQELVTMLTKTGVNIRVNEARMVLPSLIVDYPIRDKKCRTLSGIVVLRQVLTEFTFWRRVR